VRIRFKHLVEDRDRHGNIRLYVRVPGRQKVRIRATFGTDEFIAAYNDAIADHVTAPRQANEAKRGSFRYLCVRFYSSAAFKALDISTRNWQRRALDEIAKEHGAKPVAMMAARHVRRIRDAKIETPAAANQRVKALRAMFSWANEAEETTVNPTIGVKKLKYVSAGHHTWSARRRGSHSISCGTRRAAARTCPGSAANIFATAVSVSVKPRTNIAIRSKSTFRCIQALWPALRQRKSAT
jgi:integrase/recombinase XerD